MIFPSIPRSIQIYPQAIRNKTRRTTLQGTRGHVEPVSYASCAIACVKHRESSVAVLRSYLGFPVASSSVYLRLHRVCVALYDRSRRPWDVLHGSVQHSSNVRARTVRFTSRLRREMRSSTESGGFPNSSGMPRDGCENYVKPVVGGRKRSARAGYITEYSSSACGRCVGHAPRA